MNLIKIENTLLFLFLFILLIFVLSVFYFFIYKILKKEKKYLSSFEVKNLKKIFLVETLLIMSIFTFLFSFTGIKIKTNDIKGNVFLVLIDTSGSMNADDIKPSRLEAAKEITKNFVNDIDGYIGIITFSNFPKLIQYPTKDKKELKKKIDNITALGGTNIGDALNLAYSILDNFQGYNKYIILLSDGKPTIGPNPLEIVKKNKNKAVVYTIAIGNDNVILGYDIFGNPLIAEIDKELLKKIANITGGKYFEAKNYKQLSNSFFTIKKETSKYYYKDVSSYLKNLSFILILIYLTLKLSLTLLI